jgi:hypothetical protein
MNYTKVFEKNESLCLDGQKNYIAKFENESYQGLWKQNKSLCLDGQKNCYKIREWIKDVSQLSGATLTLIFVPYSLVMERLERRNVDLDLSAL